MSKLARAITCYNGATLSPVVRSQIVAMAPKYIDDGIDAEVSQLYDLLPGSFLMRYFNLTDLPNNGSQMSWGLARAALNGMGTPESIMLHFKADTVVNILGTYYLVPGFGSGAASTLAEARVAIYAHPVSGTFPRVMTNFSTPEARRVWKEFAIEQRALITYAAGKYPRGIWLDNATATTFNVDCVTMAASSRDGRDVWGVSVLAGGGAWGATGSYVYRIVPSTPLGDGIASKDYAVSITVATQRVQLDWSATGSGTYKIYRKPSAASWTSGDWRIATVTGATTYTDTGTAPIGASGGPTLAGQLVEAPAGMTFQSPEYDDWKWEQGHGLWIRELMDEVASSPGWLAGRPFKVVANTANHPGLPTDFIARYANFAGTGVKVCDGVFREFEGSPIRNSGLAEPMSMFLAFEAAAAAGLDCWETGYNYQITYPSGTAAPFGRTLSAFEIMSGVVALAWLVRATGAGAGSHILGYANTWSPEDTVWQHNTWPIWDLDLGTPLGPPSVIASGAGWSVYGREYTGGYVTCRMRSHGGETMAASMDRPVTLPAGNWLPVVDLNGGTGPQVTGPIAHMNGHAMMFLRAGAPAPDTTAPAAITLAVGSPTPTSLTLSWTAVGDDGVTGTATAYEVRRSTAPITPANFASATLCTGPPAPAVAGTAQQMVISGLTPGSTWYFALRASDEVPNWGPVSNSPSGQTTPQPADVTAPAAIDDLTVTGQTANSVTLEWSAPGGDLGVGQAAAYELRYGTAPYVDGAPLPVMANGSLYPSHTPQLTANFLQDVGNMAPATALSLITQAGETNPILHFVPPITALYAAVFSAICDAEYQLTTFGGPSNDWRDPAANVAGAPDGAFGTPTAARVVAGNLLSRTFTRATLYCNLSQTVSVAYPGGTLAPLGAAIVQLAGYGSSNLPGYFPQRGGIYWGQTTPAMIAILANWKTWIGNNSQTEGPTEGINSLTPVADWRAARAAAVPTNPTGRFLESHNGLSIFVDASGAPSVYWPLQQRIHAFAALDPTHRYIYENGVPLEGVSLGSLVRYYDVRDDALQEFLAQQFQASVIRCGADGIFGDEWHAIHPLRGSLHPTVPQDVDQTAGMVRVLETLNSDFASGTLWSTPAPLPAGTTQSVTVTGLNKWTRYYFAIRSTDEVGNVSLLSNVAAPPVFNTEAPVEIMDLAATATGQGAVQLSWSSPIELDDGPPGDHLTALAYDVRYSTSLITELNFAAATPVPVQPVPTEPAESAEALTVSGLAASTLYYFAIKSVDRYSNWSILSNVATATTAAPPDVVGPAAVANLAVSIPTQTSLRVTWTAPGDDGAVGTATEYDMRLSTAVITEANFSTRVQVSGMPTPSPSGSSESKVVTPLSSGTTYFFAIKTRDEAGNWSAISNVPSGATTSGADVTAPSTIANLATTNPTSSSLTLTWTAPGDDAAVGTATSYEIRYSTSTIDAGNFASATLVSGPPVPQVAGTAQSKIVTGLAAGTTYFFAMKATDDAGNVSALSNVPSGTTGVVADVVAPDAVTNLSVVSVTTTTATLSWTAPGDDAAAGTAAAYDIRFSEAPITSGNFSGAAQASGEPAPAVAGTVQSFQVTGLSAGTLYYFAMKTLDEVPNTSAVSNVATGTTTQLPDTTPPSAVANLAAPIGLRTEQSITLTWTSPGDDAGVGVAALYDIRYSTALIDASNFDDAPTAGIPPAPSVAGTTQSMVVGGLTSDTLYYFSMKSIDDVGNTSDLSNVISRLTAPPPVDTVAPNDVSDLEVVSVGPHSVKLQWTAPGDDGNVGTAAQYDIRFSLEPITAFTFAANTPANLEPSPMAPGAVQELTVTGLEESTLYYFAMRVLDEAGNSSALSNVVSEITTGAVMHRIRCLFVNRVRVRVEA